MQTPMPINEVDEREVGRGGGHEKDEEGTRQETTNRRWLAGIYAYYGARPSWEEGK